MFDALCVGRGAVDHTLANASTFLTEMHQLGDILHRVSTHSLVLIDELCRGTTASEGLPLTVSLCRHLIERGVLTCVATQWTELLSALIAVDETTVPSGDRSSAAPLSKQAYGEQARETDKRFIDRLEDLDFPIEFIRLVATQLSSSPQQ